MTFKSIGTEIHPTRSPSSMKSDGSSHPTWIVRNSARPERAAEVVGSFGSYQEPRNGIISQFLK